MYKLNYYENGESGELSNTGKKLKAIGLNPDNISDSEENQTKAATVIMLNNYDDLKTGKHEVERNSDGTIKTDKNGNPIRKPNAGRYDKETDTWSITGDDGKVWSYPAEYILAGAWSAGSGGQNRKKYKQTFF